MPAIGEKRPTQVGTSATLVYQPVGSRDTVTMVNESKDVAFIGQASVTATTGLPLWPGEKITLNRVPMALYAVSSASTPPPFISVVAGTY